MVFKVDLRCIIYHSYIIKTDQSIQAFRETLLEKGDKPMRKRWIKRFAVVALATAVSVYTVPKTGLLAALGLSQTTEAEEASSDQKGPGGNGTPPEAPFETRYFSVVLDASGKVTSTNLNNIAAVSEDQAKKLAQKVMKTSGSKGFTGIYRYAKAAQSDGTLIAFTDCNKALDTFYKNMRISGLVSLAGVAAVFVLVVIFSRLVFRPIAESYEKQKQFITDASHEIKTPLTIIDANVEVIEMMSGENKWTKSTKNQVKRLASLAGQLITLSRMDEGDGMADKMKFSMTDAVIDTTSSFESVAETKGRKLVCDIEENLYFVGEEKRIREMFGIFLDNAVKYSTEGSEIHVSLERKGRKLIYQISNETDQIAKGNQDVLFERFYRSDASRNSATGGSGIGLSVAKAVAEAHHGKLTAESKDGKSLTITLTVSPAA